MPDGRCLTDVLRRNDEIWYYVALVTPQNPLNNIFPSLPGRGEGALRQSVLKEKMRQTVNHKPRLLVDRATCYRCICLGLHLPTMPCVVIHFLHKSGNDTSCSTAHSQFQISSIKQGCYEWTLVVPDSLSIEEANCLLDLEKTKHFSQCFLINFDRYSKIHIQLI